MTWDMAGPNEYSLVYQGRVKRVDPGDHARQIVGP